VVAEKFSTEKDVKIAAVLFVSRGHFCSKNLRYFVIVMAKAKCALCQLDESDITVSCMSSGSYFIRKCQQGDSMEQERAGVQLETCEVDVELLMKV